MTWPPSPGCCVWPVQAGEGPLRIGWPGGGPLARCDAPAAYMLHLHAARESVRVCVLHDADARRVFAGLFASAGATLETRP